MFKLLNTFQEELIIENDISHLFFTVALSRVLFIMVSPTESHRNMERSTTSETGIVLKLCSGYRVRDCTSHQPVAARCGLLISQKTMFFY